MVIRVYGSILSRVGGATRSVSASTIRAASGPIRYNPQIPGRAKPTRQETNEDATGVSGLSHSVPQPLLPRWKRRAPKTDTEWHLRKREEQKRFWAEQDDDDDVGSDASAEMQRLKAEMQFRDSSPQSSQAPPSSSQTHAEEIDAVPAVEESESESETETDRLVAAMPDLEKISAVGRKRSFGTSGLFYGDGRKFEGLDFVSSNSNPPTKYPLEGSGLFDGDERKAQGLAKDFFEDSADGMLVEAEEEDNAVAEEKRGARNYSLRLLATAPQTAHKLRQKLIGRSVSAPVIESTIADLQRCGLQSDLEYAEAFARSRWRSALWGPQRLKQELNLRGVCPEDVATALEKVFTTTDNGFAVDSATGSADERESATAAAAAWGMTRAAKEHLLEKARLQWARGRGGSISAETRKRRMVGWLMRRGFNWSITAQILKSLESEVDIVQ